MKYSTPEVDARLAEAEARAIVGAEARGDVADLAAVLKEGDDGIGKSFAEAEWLDRYVSCILRSTL